MRGSLPALRDPAGQLRCLPNQTRHELLVELVVLVDVEVAYFLVLGLAGAFFLSSYSQPGLHAFVLRRNEHLSF
jgi:hypothetical protein